MCPPNEIYKRAEVEQSSISAFERDATGGNFNSLAIKCYNRSAADKKMNDKSDLRPKEILRKTVEYLRECIVDLDRLPAGTVGPYYSKNPSFYDVYSFSRDRIKSIT